MAGPHYRLTEAADQDITSVLQDSARQFGPLQCARYAGLIEEAILLIARDPETVASRPRPDLAPDLRSFHVEHAAGRRGAASHILYYMADEHGGIIVIRLLHEAMEPNRHIAGGLD